MLTMFYTKFTMNNFFVTIVLSWCSLWLNKWLTSLSFLFGTFFYHHIKILNIAKMNAISIS